MRIVALTILFLAAAFGSAHAAERGIVTQLGTDHVNVTTRFTGQKILIFGALSRRGQILIKVRSPAERVALSRKAKYGPFWLNSDKMVIPAAPGLIYLLASAPVGKLLDEAQRRRYGLTLHYAVARLSAPRVPAGMEGWRKALIRAKRRDGYYREDGSAVSLVRDRLFYASVELPAKIPLGRYDLEIYLIRDGRIVSRQLRTVDVREVRLERWASDVAHDYPWLFGVAFTALAMALGLVLGIALNRAGES
ncbi:MAG TPA: hypothetical protein ENI71_01885 [Chromatiales bacterium]|nr:hypothetical protein [Chromatiales bacterium]